jgi:hypothetical protein
MKERIIDNWHGTLAGLVSAFFGFVLFAPEHFDKWPVVRDIAAYVFAGGLAGLGIFSVTKLPKKDS